MKLVMAVAVLGLGLGSTVCGCGPQATPVAPTSASAPAAPTLAGKWVGEAKLATGNDITKIKNTLSGGKMTGPSSLTLDADGKGFLKVAEQKEEPITWKQEGQKVVITRGGTDYVATVSDSGDSMSIDMGDVKVKLSKS